MLIKIDIPTMMVVLFLGHLVWFVLCLVYYRNIKSEYEDRYWLFGQLLQAVSWFVFLVLTIVNIRWIIPLSNGVLWLGMAMECIALLALMRMPIRNLLVGYLVLVASSCLTYYWLTMEYYTESLNNRMVISSLVVSLIYLFPGVKFLLAKRGSLLLKVWGLLFIIFCLIRSYRAAVAFGMSDLFFVTSQNTAQSLNYTTLFLLMMINGLMFHLQKQKNSEIQIYESNQALIQLNAQLDLSSRVDSLTGLYNRRHMVEKIEEEITRFLKDRKAFSLVIADVDFFKKINDTYGHSAGDYLLKSIANDFYEVVRGEDIVARWGGEEFLFLLPDTDLEPAKMVAERIRENIEERTYSYGGIELHITMTFGISAIGSGDIAEDIIKRADHALYEGKHKGRNCVRALL